jgi:UDP-2,3-diacylglucosamine pyrophosphatase LpxH
MWFPTVLLLLALLLDGQDGPRPVLKPARLPSRPVRPARLLILSDLHLGPEPGGPFDFTTPDSGETAFGIDVTSDLEGATSDLEEAASDLEEAILASGCTRLILNGDVFDFLEDREPLSLDPLVAEQRLSAILRTPEAIGLQRAVRNVLDSGGEVWVRPGNHDLELYIPQVAHALKMVWPGVVLDTSPYSTFEFAGFKIGLDHGNDADSWNVVKPALVRAGNPMAWPAGSHLVKDLLNPLRADEGLGFLGVLVPNDQAAAFAALCLRPDLLKKMFYFETYSFLFPLIVKKFIEEEAQELGEDITELGEDVTELGEDVTGFSMDLSESFGEEYSLVHSVREWLWRLATADLERRAVEGNVREMQLTPTDHERERALRLAHQHGLDIVTQGHTHAPRQEEIRPGVTYLNSGSWTLRMRIDPDATDPWGQLLDDLQMDPHMQTPQVQKRLIYQRTGVLIDALNGPRVCLWEGGEWRSLIDIP